MKIGIFCSANDHIDPDYFRLTEELGTWMGRHGHDLVFGGCNLGLMECIARAVRRAGGRTIGIVPAIIEKNGRTSDHADVVVPCSDLSDRKDLLLAQSDVLVALPGGVGTLDEIFTVLASHTIGYHQKKMILYNMKGFWDSTIALLDDLEQRGFVRGHRSDFIDVAPDFDSLTRLLGQVAR